MPTYEYVCKSCGEPLEVFQSFHDEPLKVCPKCRGELRKVFGSIGITFKGSGFYRTDSRSNSSATRSPAKSAEAGSESTKAETTKSESTKTETTKSEGTKSESASSGSASGSSGSTDAA
ncbi:MAG: FmdB family transcriptional regulator [Acidimicrobiaceae bacterium]|nr:FmdB family transcriptional regulator [Acidimicrobiaceae bacterium]